MLETNPNNALGDPNLTNWHEADLPNGWVDDLNFKSPLSWLMLVKAVFFSRNKRIHVDQRLLQELQIPKYALQEFHNIPCGNYSHLLTKGYIKGFEVAMLNMVEPIRREIAKHLQNCQSILDIGCGGGTTASMLYEYGAQDVWGIDPSPYLLKHASSLNPKIKFVQGVAEHLPFANERFDGLSACYVLHEIPPKYIKQLIAEAYRTLKKGGRFVIAEPSPVQYQHQTWQLLKTYGVKGVYFKMLARKLNEPFVQAFHSLDLEMLFTEAGFKVVFSEKSMPHRFICVEKS